jgi:hypothetical protein
MRWHHREWARNNSLYFANLHEFEEGILKRTNQPASDNDRANFYKEFLDLNYQTQIKYYRAWLQKLGRLIWLNWKSSWSQVTAGK